MSLLHETPVNSAMPKGKSTTENKTSISYQGKQRGEDGAANPTRIFEDRPKKAISLDTKLEKKTAENSRSGELPDAFEDFWDMVRILI